MRSTRSEFAIITALCVSAAGCAFVARTAARSGDPGTTVPQSAHVLLVGTFHGKAGQYDTIQAAVDAAHSGDWILVAPGDYHEGADHTHPLVGDEASGGVRINKAGIHLRGMDRNGVIVDGTLATSNQSCSNDPAAQDLGVVDSAGNALGRNGIVVWHADNVSVENLTVCNFLSGAGGNGNEIWWNGGDETGTINMRGYTGRYLTATSSYFGSPQLAASYGIFSSNTRGFGLWDQVYASNFSDSGMYVGACKRECDMRITNAWMQYSALGYSGTNSGGEIVIDHSQFDHNKDGFDTNTQIAGDPPAPQDGRCLHGARSSITHSHSCWVFTNNWVHDNNDPNVPQQGSASAGPVGTGMTISGGRFDTIQNNLIENNGAWGILVVPYPDSGTPDLGQTCAGLGGTDISGFGCVLESEGIALVNNTFANNGFFGNPSNGDFGELVIIPGRNRNCYRGNTIPDGSTPSDLQTTNARCDGVTTASDIDPDLFAQVLCDTGFGSCPAGSVYPQPTGVQMRPLPQLPSMANPCQNVPDNAWCASGTPV